VRNFSFMIILCVLLVNVAFAQSQIKLAEAKFEGLLNQLLAPGPLMIGHAKYEHADCLKCHEPAGGIPNSKCLDCHKEIKAHVELGNAFHGLMKAKPCIDCHKDHKGRSYDAVFVNQKTFDHSKTGFMLDGAHSKTDCAKCHTEKRLEKPIRQQEILYFGTTRSCNQCHKNDDIHFFKGKFKQKECEACHSTQDWKPAKDFDHKRQTSYELIGAHAKHKCEKCHARQGAGNARYDWPLESKQCLSCHKDHHGDRLSPKFRNGKCGVCHGQDSWKFKL